MTKLTNNKLTRSPIVAAKSVVDEVVTQELNEAEDEDVSTRASDTRVAATRNSTTNNKAKRIKDNSNLVKKFLDVIDRPMLDIPDSVKNRFKEEGYELRWIRYRIGKNGQDDVANVARKINQLGYSFVKSSDIPEFSTEIAGLRTISHQGFGDLITVDEMALAKIHVDSADAYREALRQKVDNASQGIVTSLNDSRLKPFLKQDPFQ